MFIGHFAAGLAGKKFAPRASLAALFLAATLADIAGSMFLPLGVESIRISPGANPYLPLEFVNISWSHSLLMLAVYGVALALLFRAGGGSKRTAAVIATLVLSHWVLDWITHEPDMPLYPGGKAYGLSLWNNLPWTMIIEIGLYVAGVALYLSATRAKDKIGSWGFFALAALLLALFVFDALDQSVPPSLEAFWIPNLLGVAVTMVWAGWVDRHRSARER